MTDKTTKALPPVLDSTGSDPICADCDSPMERDREEDVHFLSESYLGWKCPACGWQQLEAPEHGNV